MRNEPTLHVSHLEACVKQQVITHDQLEGILAVSRSIRASENNSRPDVGWFVRAQTLGAAMGVGLPIVYMLTDSHNLLSSELMQLCGVGSLVSILVGLWLRRTGSGRAAAGVLIAGGVALSWGVGAGVWALVHGTTHPTISGDPFSYYDYPSLNAAVIHARLAGDAGVFVVAIVLGVVLKVPALAGTACGALLHGLVGYAGHDRWSSHITFAALEFAVAGVILAILGRVWDRVRPSQRLDPSFWLHCSGLLATGFGFVVLVSDGPGAIGPALVWVALAVGAGFRWQRWIYFAAAAVGVLLFPALAAKSNHPGDLTIPVFAASALAVVVGSAIVRRAIEKRDAGERASERLIWA